MADKRFQYPVKGWNNDSKELWRSITESFELQIHERIMLQEVCTALTRLAWINDEIESAELVVPGRTGPVIDPRVVEARLLLAAIQKGLHSLRIPELSDQEDQKRPQRRSGTRGNYGTIAAAAAGTLVPAERIAELRRLAEAR